MSVSASLFVSIPALIVSSLSLYFSRKSWHESNRPIIIVRVSTYMSGNLATVLNLVIENTGNRPAKNIKLSVDSQELKSAFSENIKDRDRQAIERCFADDIVIPCLANGKSISNSFGKLTVSYDTDTATELFWHQTPSDWQMNARFHVIVEYQDLNNRNYECSIPILIANDEGFAGSSWQKKN
jgi:hypothetical protein